MAHLFGSSFVPRLASTLFLLLAWLLVSPASAQTRNTVSISGIVVDEVGGAIGGARVTASDANGATVQTTTSDGAGAFSLRGLAPGTYSVLVEMNLFAPLAQRVVVSASGSVTPVRVVLKAGGFSENVVVTARRVETRVAETPQKIEVIDSTDIERSVAADLTDVLKKNSGVDVVQYSGALSGIGIRGFRPQTSGINKRSLLLIDGRPSGVTNLATLLLDNVERIEVLKGAASAVYGSSAMGGVVNVITRQSRGKIGGNARIGTGSFGVTEFAGRVGGSLSSRVDLDATGSAFDQRDDYRMGNGEIRPATRYKTYDGTVRVGADLATGWRIDGRVDAYRGRDIMTPGDLATGINSQGRKNLERSTEDARLTGRVGAHDLAFTGYVAKEAGHTFNVTSTNPLDSPFLPYLSFESDLQWVGLQAKDSWNWSKWNSVVLGLDYEKVTSVSRSYTRTGDRSAPFSADSHKGTAGVYVEDTLKLANGRTVVAVGGRVDRISNETVDTPLKTNFTPSDSTFTVFNPSLGVKHELVKGLRGHFTVGRAFIPAEAIMLTGFTTTVVGGRTQISQGNPDLGPERSTSFDVGAEWTAPATRFDVTGLPDGREGPFHLQRRRQQSASSRPDRRLGGQRTGRAHQRAGPRGGTARRRPRGPLRERDALLPPQGTARDRRGAGHSQCRAEHRARRRGRRLRTPQQRACRAATCRAARTTTSTPQAFRSSTTTTSPSSMRAARTAWRASTRSSSRSTTCSTRSITRSSAFRCRARRSKRRTGSGSSDGWPNMGDRSLGARLVCARAAWSCRAARPPVRSGRGPAQISRKVASRSSTRPRTTFRRRRRSRTPRIFNVEYRRSYKVVTVKDVSAGGPPDRYVLVQCGTPAPTLAGELAGAQVVTVPITSLFAFSTTNLPLLVDLDRVDVLTGVAQFDAVVSREVQARIKTGKVVEFARVGLVIDVERVVTTKPSLLLAGSTSGATLAVIRSAGVPVVANSEWLESTALGRAEWLKYLAVFLNEERKAQSVYSAMKSRYRSLSARATAGPESERPLVMTGRSTRGLFTIAGGRSYVAALIRDAGGRYAWADNTAAGIASVDLEAQIQRAANADVWINGGGWKNLAEMLEDEPRYSAFKAYRQGQVWVYERPVRPGSEQ